MGSWWFSIAHHCTSLFVAERFVTKTCYIAMLLYCYILIHPLPRQQLATLSTVSCKSALKSATSSATIRLRRLSCSRHCPLSLIHKLFQHQTLIKRETLFTYFFRRWNFNICLQYQYLGNELRYSVITLYCRKWHHCFERGNLDLIRSIIAYNDLRYITYIR